MVVELQRGGKTSLTDARAERVAILATTGVEADATGSWCKLKQCSASGDVPKHQFDVNLRRDPERKWGQGLFISSESALNTPKEMVHYGMTKTAQLAVSSGRAESCAGTGVYGERDPSGTYPFRRSGRLCHATGQPPVVRDL